MFPPVKRIKAPRIEHPHNMDTAECCEHVASARGMLPPHPHRLMPEPAKGRAFHPTPANLAKSKRFVK